VALGFKLICASAVISEGEAVYDSVTGPCRLEFPADHGAHPGFRTEWWYYTGNLETVEGRLFGFQLTIFRRQISPPEAKNLWPDPHSEWRTQQVFLGHAALTDISRSRHYSAEAIARGAKQLAGVSQTPDETVVFLKRWRIRIDSNGHKLAAISGDFQLDLDLVPLKPIVLHGKQGYSRKGDAADRASCYYSFTRLKTEGRIKINEQDVTVSGTSWMDHEFSTASLQPGIDGWDWFSLQLDSNEELMIYILRQTDGTPHPASSGTIVQSDGATHHLSFTDFHIDVLAYWRSPHSNGLYPARWQLTVPSKRAILTVIPNLADQEMRTPDSTNVTYWEGSVSVTGQTAGAQVKGEGYVELTGYAEKFTHLR
jgi:predicted secreted hydrolase